MKQFSLVLNVVLLVAVGGLYYLHFSGNKTTAATVRTSAAAVNAGNHSQIAYVDLDSLNAHISVIKIKRKELEANQKAIETEWENGMRTLESRKNEFIRKGGNTITQEQAQQFQGELIQEQQKIEQRKQQATQDLSEKSYKFLEDIQKKMKDFLGDYNKDKNYTYIFTVGSGQDYMAYKDSAFNITADVIEGMNEKLNKDSKP
jgi:outer membrane protein